MLLCLVKPRPVLQWYICLVKPRPVLQWYICLVKSRLVLQWYICLVEPRPVLQWYSCLAKPRLVLQWYISLVKPRPVLQWHICLVKPRPVPQWCSCLVNTFHTEKQGTCSLWLSLWHPQNETLVLQTLFLLSWKTQPNWNRFQNKLPSSEGRELYHFLLCCFDIQISKYMMAS